MVLLISSSYSLQFKRGPEHDGAAAEGVVVGVGVDAVEDGVGVVALVQEVVEFEAENEALPFVLGRGVEHGADGAHVLVLQPVLALQVVAGEVLAAESLEGDVLGLACRVYGGGGVEKHRVLASRW